MAIKEEKEIKKFQTGKEEIKLLLLANNMMLYIENHIALINELGKVSEYKINTQKSLASLYTNNKISERDVKEAIPFTIATKRMKYLGMNCSNEDPA